MCVCVSIVFHSHHMHSDHVLMHLYLYITRPSASELLKHPFFKKAKSKEFVREVVLGDAPSLQARARSVKRRPGASGRLHRTEEGAWVWSDDEMTEDFESGDAGDKDSSKVYIYIYSHVTYYVHVHVHVYTMQ